MLYLCLNVLPIPASEYFQTRGFEVRNQELICQHPQLHQFQNLLIGFSLCCQAEIELVGDLFVTHELC
jgi:hypothetical protein